MVVAAMYSGMPLKRSESVERLLVASINDLQQIDSFDLYRSAGKQCP